MKTLCDDPYDSNLESVEIDSVDEKNRPNICSGEVFIAALTGVDENGVAQIKCNELFGDALCAASSTIVIEPRIFGRQVALMFLSGDIKQPVIIGVIRTPLIDMLDSYISIDSGKDEELEQRAKNIVLDDSVDGLTYTQTDKKIVLEAAEEICLKCGDASITLAKDGKISIRGKYILNRSTGLNRIMGGSVDIN